MCRTMAILFYLKLISSKNHLMKILVTFLVLYEMLVFDLITEAYSELSQSSKIELFVKIAKGFQRLTVLPKSSILSLYGNP